MGSAFDGFGRFARPAQQVVNILAAGPRTPSRIRREVGARCGDDLGPGTLFGTIARLERRALIEVVTATEAPRAYRLTALGAETLEVQLASLTRSTSTSSPAPRSTLTPRSTMTPSRSPAP
jgi:DNA-binding PadR family transcriptional regulator